MAGRKKEELVRIRLLVDAAISHLIVPAIPPPDEILKYIKKVHGVTVGRGIIFRRLAALHYRWRCRQWVQTGVTPQAVKRSKPLIDNGFIVLDEGGPT